MTTKHLETRINLLASVHLYVKSEKGDVPLEDEDLISEAFEAAHEAAKRVLSSRSDLTVEVEH